VFRLNVKGTLAKVEGIEATPSHNAKAAKVNTLAVDRRTIKDFHGLASNGYQV
jgi:hypothetical protein